MKRRGFIALVGGAATWPLAARAQQVGQVKRIGVLQPYLKSDSEAQRRIAAFEQGLKNLGWMANVNVQIDYRWAGSDPESIQTQADELVDAKPDAILAITVLTLRPLMRKTRTIPIVFTQVYDPVSGGFVDNLARPGGNVTGLTLGEFSLAGKMLEVLKELAPQVNRVAVILNPDQSPNVAMLRVVETVAPSFGVQLTTINVKEAADIELAINPFAGRPNGGLLVLPSVTNVAHRELIITLADRHRLPAIYGFNFFASSGGLASYGVDSADLFRRAASYIDRIFKGEKPADLPVQNPTKFEMIINLKTAKALGVTVPPKLLFTADEVIE